MTTIEKKENIEFFDLIASLGGNCAAAGQLKKRTMRKESLPFDYFFLRDEGDIKKFIEAFKNDFEGCFLKENLRLLKGDERGVSELKYQYQDMVSGYNIIHLFHDSKDNEQEYKRCKEIIDRRLKRFYNYCSSAKTICLIMSLAFELSEDIIDEMYSVIKSRFREKEIHLILTMYSCKTDEDIKKDTLRILRHKREINDYDFSFSNYDWHWIDSLKLNKSKNKSKNYFCRIFKKDKFLTLHLLNYFSTLLRAKLYLFGYRIDICIGRYRQF
mgnify:CR=1 FL=1